MWNSKSSHKIVLPVLLSALPFSAFAQNGTIKGTVTDANGEPLIGVSIQEKGTKNATVTDVDGHFTLQSKNNATLLVSYVGYVTQQVNTSGKTTFTIALKEDNTTLNDVVVIGYGVQKKSDLTGSVASVKSEDLQFRSTTDAAAALQGKPPYPVLTPL